MTAVDPHINVKALPDCARRAPLGDALTTLCRAVTGQQGYLANAGFVLRGAAAAPVLDVDGAMVEQLAGDEADPVLAHLGLSLALAPGSTASSPKTLLPSLMLRLGLLERMLDLAHEHLQPRVSFGQKTLKHQLVKTSFAQAYATGLTLREKAGLRLETGALEGLAEDHAELTRAEIQAEKLMGGHGYLLGGTHGIAYLSMLVGSIYGSDAS